MATIVRNRTKPTLEFFALASLWFKSADGIWIGDQARYKSIPDHLRPPAGLDCRTVTTLEDILAPMKLAGLASEFGNDSVAVDALPGIARVAAARLKEILSEDIPADCCGYYFGSLLQLGRVVGSPGFRGGMANRPSETQ